jgi:hypothetical protein
MARAVSRPVVPAPDPVAEPPTADVAVVHFPFASLSHVPDGVTLWVPHPVHERLVYQSGQLLPNAVRYALGLGARLVPGPPGVLVLDVNAEASRAMAAISAAEDGTEP